MHNRESEDDDVVQNQSEFVLSSGALIEYAMILYKKQKVHHHRYNTFLSDSFFLCVNYFKYTTLDNEGNAL